MPDKKPERIRWAIEVLSVRPDETILEIGCGNGHAVELICQHLTTGRIVGIDRSSTAVRTAEANNQQCINAGRARFLNAQLSELHLNERFEKIFAVNVNLFWTGPRLQLAALHFLKKEGGHLYLFYEPPSASQLEKILQNARKNLEAENFEIVDVLRKRLSASDGICIVAKEPAG
jgi:protein-L-isoaspartate O-methyltransferase